MRRSVNSNSSPEFEDAPSPRRIPGSPPVLITESSQEGDEELSLQQLLTVLRRRLPVLLGVTLLSGAAISAFVLTRPPSYSGSFRLLVEPVTTGSRLAESLTSDTLQTLKPLGGNLGANNGLDYISQMEVLKSETILEPVIRKIQGQYPEVNYKTLSKQMKIVRPKESKVLDITYDGKNPEEIRFVLSQLAEAFIQYSVTDRQTNLKRGITFVEEQIQRQRRDVSGLEGALENFRRTNNLVDPKIYAESLSDQMRTVSTAQQENRVQLAASQTLYGQLNQQLGMDPSSALGLANLSESPSYQNLLLQLRTVESKIAVESARFRANTPIVQALDDQRQKLLPLIQEEAIRVAGAASPEEDGSGYQGSVGRDLTKQLVEAANQVQVRQTQEDAFNDAIAVLNQNTQRLAGVSRNYGQIQRDLEIATASLNRLLTARENLQLESTRQITPWDLISKFSDRSILPKSNSLLLLMLGAFTSAILGIGAALVAEQLDRVYHTIEDLRELPFPCLGVIPFLTNLSQTGSLSSVGRLAVGESITGAKAKVHRNEMVFMESFYSLDANLRLLSADSPIKSITVTSTTPADGKSTISSHLAWAAVTMGRKVLLIDTDLRRPQAHLWFGVSNLRGLSNAITSDTDILDLIQESPQDANLHVLAAGPQPPAPGRLLSSNKMRSLLEQLSQTYDLVICDAPPVLGFADAKITAAYTDGLLLVIGLGKTDRNAIARAIDELNTNSNATILGLVANGLKRYTSNYYNSYYNRYYSEEGGEKLQLPDDVKQISLKN
jgi:polysaccharide biosynthesis transport protein